VKELLRIVGVCSLDTPIIEHERKRFFLCECEFLAFLDEHWTLTIPVGQRPLAIGEKRVAKPTFLALIDPERAEPEDPWASGTTGGSPVIGKVKALCDKIVWIDR
jgi:hypothetical protein